MTDDRRLEQIRADHWQETDAVGEVWCPQCEEPWPCQVAYLLERLEEAQSFLQEALDSPGGFKSDLAWARKVSAWLRGEPGVKESTEGWRG